MLKLLPIVIVVPPCWVKVPAPARQDDDSDDSGALLVPGVDPTHAARDAVWRALEEGDANGIAAEGEGFSFKFKKNHIVGWFFFFIWQQNGLSVFKPSSIAF